MERAFRLIGLTSGALHKVLGVNMMKRLLRTMTPLLPESLTILNSFPQLLFGRDEIFLKDKSPTIDGELIGVYLVVDTTVNDLDLSSPRGRATERSVYPGEGCGTAPDTALRKDEWMIDSWVRTWEGRTLGQLGMDG